MTDEEKLKRVRDLQQGGGEDEKGLELLWELLELKTTFKERVNIRTITAEERNNRLGKGESLVSREELGRILPLLVDRWKEVEKLFRDKAILQSESVDPGLCLRKFIEGGGDLFDMVQCYGDRGELLHYIMIETLKPLYGLYGEAYGKQMDDATWEEPFCFICGGLPDMGLLEGDGGKRYLRCGLCDTKWRYAKLKCPYCGNEDLEKLVSLSFEDEPLIMLNGCKACDRYLKVIDIKDRDGALFYELEDLRTAHLDAMARREGFRPY